MKTNTTTNTTIKITSNKMVEIPTSQTSNETRTSEDIVNDIIEYLIKHPKTFKEIAKEIHFFDGVPTPRRIADIDEEAVDLIALRYAILDSVVNDETLYNLFYELTENDPDGYYD